MQVKNGNKVETFEDILRILKENPQWLEELRRIILTEDLLTLPKRFNQFIENEFKPLRKDVDILKQDVAVLKQDVAILKEDVAILKEEMAKMKVDIGFLKGELYELKLEKKAPAISGRIIKRCKVLDKHEYVNLLDDALDEGKITLKEREDALEIDLVVSGLLMKDPSRKVYFAVEASVKADRRDVERAHRRAKIIEKAISEPVLGVVVCMDKTEGAIKKSNELDVLLTC